jgi:predicted amidohydrolase
MAEIASLLGNSAQPDRDAELLVFPEATLPLSERRDFEQLVSSSGKAALIGMLWRKLPQASRARLSSKTGGWLVNEACLHIPVGSTSSLPLYRTFTIRKPLPNHTELALARTLSAQQRARWRILPGRRWYRFVHDQWGDFTVAICSDLLDPRPWAMLRGQLMHLFQCAFNQDIDLFRSLTWVRAYETFVNVVSTNHGVYGGSFDWTPKSKHRKTIALLEGSRLSVAADVLLPVKELHHQQLQGSEHAVEAATQAVWTEKKKKGRKPNPFKSPPPGYRRR